MLEKTESLLPNSSSRTIPLRAICVGFETDSLEELRRLLLTLEIQVLEVQSWNLRKINPATYVGKGKLEELKEHLSFKEVDLVAFDVELSPNQLRNLEKLFEKNVIDRPGVIIEIFSRHARTKEAKTQVALARLQYLMSRLTHFWSHFERQRGGIGLKGMGEKQIEVDRRLVKKRMAILRERLAAIERERSVQRSGRVDILKVALVGYTNAGKSTLLNALTHSEVRVEDKLFATLDASVRALDPHSRPPVVMIDTVGFIKNLPPSLVASFRSTLEELYQADLLLHVVDASSPQAREQFEVTEKILKEMNLGDKKRMTVLNKIDLLKEAPARNRARVAVPGAFLVSALSPQDMLYLREQILKQFWADFELLEIVVPYSESKVDADLHLYGNVECQRHLEKGTFYRLRIEAGMAKKLRLEKYRT